MGDDETKSEETKTEDADAGKDETKAGPPEGKTYTQEEADKLVLAATKAGHDDAKSGLQRDHHRQMNEKQKQVDAVMGLKILAEMDPDDLEAIKTIQGSAESNRSSIATQYGVPERSLRGDFTTEDMVKTAQEIVGSSPKGAADGDGKGGEDARIKAIAEGVFAEANKNGTKGKPGDPPPLNMKPGGAGAKEVEKTGVEKIASGLANNSPFGAQN